jgi:hypothetical protein
VTILKLGVSMSFPYTSFVLDFSAMPAQLLMLSVAHGGSDVLS